MKAVETPAGEAGAEARFSRRSSGLVREVGAFDTLLYGLNAVAIAYVVFALTAWVAYPGASLELATLIAMVGAVVVGATYVLLSVAYPRSGGEYVFVSRVLHPALGFAASVTQVFWQAFYIGVNGAFFALFALSPTLSALGVQSGADWLVDAGTFFGKDAGVFIAGGTLVLVFASLAAAGTLILLKVQRWCIVIAGISLAVTLCVLLLTAVGAIDFKDQFNELAGGAGAYDGVITRASEAGVDVNPGFSLSQTVAFAIWPAFSLFFTVLAVSFGGEVRNIRRSETLGIVGSVVVGGLILIAIMLLTRLAVGSEFLRASAADPEFPLALPPFMNVFSFIAGGSTVLSVVMSLWVLLLFMLSLVVGIIYCSRGVLAWGIDGVVPSALAEVNPRTHTPVASIALVALVALICLALYAFTDLFVVLSGLLGFGFVVIVVCVAGTAFPTLKRSVFEGSASAIRIGRVPLIVITGVPGIAITAFLAYRAVVDDTFAANTPTSIRTAVIVAVVAVVWYAGARLIQRRRGVDLERRYAEIPIE